MAEFGGPESFTPSEGGFKASEQLSEDAKQRFAAAAAMMQQIRREEKRARKQDDRVARIIIQFLSDDQHTHLFILLSRLVARDCPSVFILAILSLIDRASRETVDEYAAEHQLKVEMSGAQSFAITKATHVTAQMNEELVAWITRMQMVMSVDAKRILVSLLVDQGNIDGTVLQLATFVLVEFFKLSRRPVTYEKLCPLTMSILQTVIEPHMHHAEAHFLKQAEAEKKGEDE